MMTLAWPPLSAKPVEASRTRAAHLRAIHNPSMDAPPVLPPSLRRWDIFCKVIDNFGDAGVTWRLARQLAREHGLEVTLWIDKPAALTAMAPGLAPNTAVQSLAGVVVRRWDADVARAAPAAVVIDAFGGGLPEDYVHAMASARTPPRWFVLEYLSAEAWVDGAHARPSPHPQSGLERTFWFPGFTANTGGLLREHDLLRRRDAFAGDAGAQASLWATLLLLPPSSSALRVSLFCYPNAPIAALLEQWVDGARPVVCMVPVGTAGTAIDQWLDGATWEAGTPVQRGQLTLHAIPFVAQDRYDELLWACDLNFVRGEDSFVRALMAGKPLVWQIYPQREDAHQAKLAAFLDRYLHSLDASAAAATRDLWRAWNGVDGTPAIAEAWARWTRAEPAIAAHARSWTDFLACLPELAAGLVMAAAAKV